MPSRPHRPVPALTIAVVLALMALASAMVAGHRAAALPAAQDSSDAWLVEDAARLTLPRDALSNNPVPLSVAGTDAWSLMFAERFERSGWPAGTPWTVYDADGTTHGEYFWAARCGGRGSSTSGWAIGGGANGASLACGTTYPNDAFSVMYAGPFDLSGATDARLDLDFHVYTECVGYQCSEKADWLRVWTSIDGENWSGIRIAGDHINDPNADPEGWRSISIDQVARAGQPRVWVAVVFESDSTVTLGGGGARIDNLEFQVDACEEVAYIRSATTDRTCYAPGARIGVFTDVGTSSGAARVTAQAALWYSPDIALDTAEQTFTAPGQTVLPLDIPTELGGSAIEPGQYEVSVSILDADTGCFQDTRTLYVRIDPECGTATAPIPTTSTPTPTATRTPEPTPDVIATLCPGDVFEETKRIFIPPSPPRADVLFAFDTTGSMEDVLESAKTNAVTLMNTLTIHIPDIQFGVVDFRDYPIEPFGDSGDWPYRLRQPITSSRSSVESAIAATAHGGGNDLPEAYSRALYESTADPSIGWRSDARRFVVMFGDTIPHDDDLNERIVSPPLNPGGVWCGVATCRRDPGRDGQPGTSDDLDFQSVLDGMRAADTTLLHVIAGQPGDMETNLDAYWTQWARWTNPGGDAVPMRDTTRLVQTIENLLTSAGRRISQLSLQTDPAGYQSWINVVPPAYEDLEIPAGGRWVTFDVDISPPPGTQSGSTHRFDIRAVGDGAVYGGQHVTIHVPEHCGTSTPTATATGRPSATPPPTSTPFVCPPARPGVAPSCSEPNYVRNPYFERFLRSWGQFSRLGRNLVDKQALEGFYSAHFDGPIGRANDEWLFQLMQVPPDVSAASFWVEEFSRYTAAVNPPPISERNYFRASIYDATLSREILRLWEFDPLLPLECPVDAPSYNLSPVEMAAIRGRTVALVFQFHKETTAWQASALLDGIHFAICSPSPPCRVEGDKTALPTTTGPGGEATVFIELTGLDGQCLPARKPADVMLVIDRSGSMERDGKLEAARAAAKAFADRFDPSSDQLGLVSFSDAAIMNQRLSPWSGGLRAEVDALTAGGETNITAAIQMAQAELIGPRHRAGSVPVMVLLSDGRPSSGTGDARAAAEAAKVAGTRIFTIGLGDDVDPDLLRQIASSPGDYRAASSGEDLREIYQEIAGVIGGSPATDITIVDVLSPHVTLVPGSFTGTPAPTVSPDGRTLTWRIPRLGLETRVWSYRIRMTETPGRWPTNQQATVSFTNSTGQPGGIVLPIPEVTVVGPVGSPDAMCRDHRDDDGTVPSNNGGEPWWDSPDIWVRNARDGGSIHQPPIVGQTNYVYVRVRNVGDAAVDDITVHVYDAPGAASIPWPGGWVPQIGQTTITRLGAGRSNVVSVPWIPTRTGHECFLVRLAAPEDAIQMDGWVPFDNNICQRNVQVVGGSGTTSTVGAGNRHLGPDRGTLRVRPKHMPAGASGAIIFPDRTLFERWKNDGGTAPGGLVDDGAMAIRFTADSLLRDVDDGSGGGASPLQSADTVGELRIERIPFEGEEFADFGLELEGFEDAPPDVSIEQWVGDRPVGGVMVRPPRQPTIYLPYAIEGLVDPTP